MISRKTKRRFLLLGYFAIVLLTILDLARKCSYGCEKTDFLSTAGIMIVIVLITVWLLGK